MAVPLSSAEPKQRLFTVERVRSLSHLRSSPTLRAEFYDANGRHLFTVIKRILALHATFDGVDANDDDKVRLLSGATCAPAQA